MQPKHGAASPGRGRNPDAGAPSLPAGSAVTWGERNEPGLKRLAEHQDLAV